MPELWYVRECRDGLKQGFRVIASRLNEVLLKRAPTVQIEAEPVREGDSLPAAAEQVKRALPGLRTLAPLPDDGRLALWTLGFINGGYNARYDLLVHHWCGLNEGLERVTGFLESRKDNWTEEHWRDWIRLPVEAQHAEWLTWLKGVTVVPYVTNRVDDCLAAFSSNGRESMVLKAMLRAKIDSPEVRVGQQELIDLTYGAGSANDNRRVFIRLEKLELVRKGTNLKGYYLTSLGIEVAGRLADMDRDSGSALQ